MTATSEADKNDKKKASVRQRKAHRKSRLGCSNCKLRSVKHPFLIHVFLAMSLLHDTHLHPSQPPSHRSSLAFHWYHATALFHQRLLAAHSSPSLSSLVSSERDALWASGALLGGAAFALLDVQDPREAWPLKRPDAMDLDWLKMSDGKKVVWRIADPSREESIFHGLVADRASMPDGRKAVPLGVLPSGFYTVFELMDSTPVTNPYHVAASLLAQLLHREPDENSVVEFLTFLTQLDPRIQNADLVLLSWYRHGRMRQSPYPKRHTWPNW
ncbi:hypothetical protein ACJ41O_000633 [Fusarium nematophilum]